MARTFEALLKAKQDNQIRAEEVKVFDLTPHPEIHIQLNFKIVLLWTYAIVLCLTIYTFGQSTYYYYQNDGGLRFSYKEYRGETIVKMWNLYDREKCSYVGTRKFFDKQPNTRKSFILIILGLSTFSAWRMNRKGKKERDFFYTSPSREMTL